MIRDVQEDDVDFYVTDELQKRLLIKNYHPIFKLEVSQFSEEEIPIEEIEEENKISILTDTIVQAGVEQTITINVEDFGGIKYRNKKSDDKYIQLTKTQYGYYHDVDEFYSDYKHENNLLNNNDYKKDNILFIDYDTQEQYVWNNSQLIKVTQIIPGQLSSDKETFTPFFTDYDDIIDSVYEELEVQEIDPEIENDTVLDVSDNYLDTLSTYSNACLFITYDNTIQLTIRNVNNKVLHKAQFPHLAYGSVEHRCIFTTPGLYFLEVTLIQDGNDINQSFNLTVVEEDYEFEIENISTLESDKEEKEIYVPNKIGNRIINPRINQPTNLKCSLNSLILNNYYIKDLLNSNRSNILFTSPTNKDYQIYKYESHNIYNNDGEIEDTWFFINANFIDEYVELHILPTYINTMDNIILLSDNDFVDYLLNETSNNESNEEDNLKQSYVFTSFDDEEYKTESIDDRYLVIAKVPVCSEPQWFDMTNFLSDENPNYKISFDCYSSYYYRSIFYINNLEIYKQDNAVCLKYDDVIDIIPYDLFDKGEHNIEFSVEDNKIALGVDEYIVSSDILETMQAPSELMIGFQQIKLDNPVNEILSVDDIDSYTYITNLNYEIINDNTPIDVTVKKITSETHQQNPYKFPLNLSRNLSRLEIDIIRKGFGPNIIGVIDRTNLKETESILDSYDETTLLDYYRNDAHVPIQYNNDDEHKGVFIINGNVETTTLNIEEINPLNDDLPNHGCYNHDNDGEANIIQTLKYFNDNLYSEAYIQLNVDLSDTLPLYVRKQYYEQPWLDKESTDTEYYLRWDSHDIA